MNFDKILTWLNRRQTANNDDGILNYDATDDAHYLSSLGEPHDDIDRSFFQYRCQMRKKGLLSRVMLNLGSLMFLPLFFAQKKPKRASPSRVVVRVRNHIPTDAMIPDEERKGDLVFDNTSKQYLDKSARLIYRSLLKRHFFSFFFRLKCKLLLADYSGIVDQYSPKAILSSNEFSFASSILTFYCESVGVQSIDLQHGEKLFQIRDSFFRFSKCYVWNSDIVNLLVSMKAEPTQFHIFTPKNLFLPESSTKTIDYIYYLQIHSPEELKKIADCLAILKSKGERVLVRYHPKYTNKGIADPIFQAAGISKDSGTITDSLGKTKNCISMFSTVLYQAFLSGNQVIIDDVSNQEKYRKLGQMKYHMLEKPHALLSKLIVSRN